MDFDAIRLSKTRGKNDGKSCVLVEFNRQSLEFCGAIRAFLQAFATIAHQSVLSNIRTGANTRNSALLGGIICPGFVVNDVFAGKNM